MTIVEATRLNKDLIDQPEMKPYPEYCQSIKLGIEAMKAVQKLRHYPFPDEILLLPGETKD